jgi:OTT_1508-like deaminase
VIRHLNDCTLTGILFYLEYGIGFQLRRWALKIMSLLISANRLFILTQSHRLRKLIQGKFSVKVLTSPITAPYWCNLSSETVQVALDAALAETGYLSADWDEERESFLELLLKELEVSEVIRWKPTVHADLALIIAMVKGEIKHVLPYIGVSKLSCIMCSHYICAFNDVTKQKIATKGSHGKAYPGWLWPSLPDLEGELRPAFLRRIKQQLFSDFDEHAKTWKRNSDSSVGSGGPGWQIGLTDDQIEEMITGL